MKNNPPKEPANTESEKHYCEKVNDKYYGKDGTEVTKEQHEKECLENPATGFTIPILSLILILSSVFVLKKFKIKNSLKKI